ncbi:MAG: MFS transporter [Anaerolineaceae bacterium]
MSSANIVRNNKTWLIYIFLCCYVFFMNLPGPINGFLKDEFQLDYTLLSLHASAFALGIVLTGLFGHFVIDRLTQWQGLAIGTIGLGAGGLMIGFGASPFVTIAGLFITGLVGTLILSIYPAVLKEEMGKHQAVGISEANMFASIVASIAPLVIGFSAARLGSWRPVVVIFSVLVGLLGLWLILDKRVNHKPIVVTDEGVRQKGRLPRKFWLYWISLVLGVSVEFCTIYYASLYSKQVLELTQSQSVQSLSLFLAGMVIGRLVTSNLVKRFSRNSILVTSIIVAAVGFGLFWWAPSTTVALLGLCLMGLGVANFYTMILSLALDASDGQEKLAASRTTLASGLAVLSLPMVLGVLADRMGIWAAFGLVGVLLMLLSGMLRWAAKTVTVDLVS